MLSSETRFFGVSVALVALANVNAPAVRAEVTVAEEYAPLPEYRVFGEPATASDAEAIADVMRRFGQAWGSSDVDGALAAYAEDAEWTNAFADVRRGRQELRDQFTRLFERFESGSNEGAETGEEEASQAPMKRGSVSLRYIGNDAAVIHSYTESDWGMNRDGGGLRRVHLTFVLEKQQNGAWLIVHQMIMDARR